MTIRVDEDLLEVLKGIGGSYSDAIRAIMKRAEVAEREAKDLRARVTEQSATLTTYTNMAPSSTTFSVPTMAGGMTEEYWSVFRSTLKGEMDRFIERAQRGY